MISIKPISVGEKTAIGIRIELPHAPLLMIVGKRGFVGCGYINVTMGEKLNDAVAIVTGVSTFEDVLQAKVVKVTEMAASLGVSVGMMGREALVILA